MTILTLLSLSLAFGLVGAFTPCALGINAVFLGYISGKPRRQRLVEWLGFALIRAVFLTALGLAFGLFGQLAGGFIRSYHALIGYLLIVLGGLFILSRFRALPLPNVHLVPALTDGSAGRGMGQTGALAMGVVFGLDIPACTSPLVLALLAQTVLVGDYLFGTISLFLFAIGMSLPLLLVGGYEQANQWIMNTARRYGTTFYVVAGGLLIMVGWAELSPPVISIIAGWLQVVADPLLTLLPG